jgi:hypothetical protein
LLVLLSIAEQSCADDLSIVPYLPNFFSADYGTDSDHGRNLFLFGNFALANQHRLSLGYGTYNDTVAGSQEELQTDTLSVGYSYSTQSNTQYGVQYEQWGDPDRITTDTVSLYASLNISKWSFSVTPELRKIEVYNASGCDGIIDSNAAALDAVFYPNDQWTLSGTFKAYDYRQDYADLINCVDIAELPLIISRLQTVADDTQLSFGVDYNFAEETIGMNRVKIDSAIDDSTTDITSIYVTSDVFTDWSITLTLSRQNNFDQTTTRFIHGTVGYYW